MHYYQFNIGDYLSHTSHLDLLEDLAYRRMIEWCYLHESPLPFDVKQIAKKIRMQEHCDCITAVLQEFFSDNDDGWFNERVVKELKTYKSLSNKRKKAANKRWANTGKASKGDASALQVASKSNTKQEPLTINQEPLTNINKDLSDSVNQVFDHWKSRLNHPRSSLDNPRKTKIKNALKNYSVDQLIEAVDGCAKSPYHMGQNDNGKVYDSIDLIFRNADKIDDFIKTNQTPIGGLSNERHQRSTSSRPDSSAAGRVRQNVAEGIAAAEREIAEIDRREEAMAANEQPLRLQMDKGIR